MSNVYRFPFEMEMNERKITTQEIAEYAKLHLNEMMTDDGEVSIRTVVKNNGQVLTGICFTPTGCNIGPTVYAEGFTEHKTVELAVAEIARTIEKHLVREDVDLGHIFQKDYLKENLRARLVNFKSNEQLLKDIPHRIVLGDLAVYPVINVMTDGIAGTCMMKDRLVAMTDMTQDEILDTALENSGKEMVISGLDEFLHEQGGPQMQELSTFKVVSNREKIYGAACFLANLDKFGKNCTVIPSSIHELIVVDEGYPEEMLSGLNEIIQAVNKESVADNEILSDHAYHFINGQLKLDIVA